MTQNRTRQKRGQKSWRYGYWSEILCSWILRIQGWQIITSRYRTPHGEIDLVALRGNTLAIIEVKIRPQWDDAHAAIQPRQQQRLIQAAHAFLGRYSHLNGKTIRFDAMLVVPWRWPRHIPDAWRLEA